jgi:hypothetical protein
MVSIQSFATSVMFTRWVSARIVATHGVGTINLKNVVGG